MKKPTKTGRHTIYAVYWEDAAFSYRKRLPRLSPSLQLSFGIIAKRTKDAIDVGMNFRYDRKRKRLLKVIDGLLIPREVIVAMVPVGQLS